MNLVTLATCNLNQWALDFDGNLRRTKESIRVARERGATYRLGPELELCGYGCEDAFYEGDTIRHSWEALAHLLEADLTDGILVDVGLPVMHHGVRYNCRALLLDGRVLLLRPKLVLADGGNYRESRWFAPWTKRLHLEEHVLPRVVQEVAGQTLVPIGDGAVATRDTVLSSETCEELFTPDSPHVALSLGGVEIVANGSASHHELRKLSRRIALVRAAGAKAGGIYLYANQQGCDGGRLYYDGSAMIAVNGDPVAIGSQFSMADVEVVTATVDLEEVRSFRGSRPSGMAQASRAGPVPRVRADLALGGSGPRSVTAPVAARLPSPDEEIARGPACWLWDYLRRSGAAGFFVPISGGADSSAVVAVVRSMAGLALEAARRGDEPARSDLRRLLALREEDELPDDPRTVVGGLLHTCYMASQQSTGATRERAARVAEDAGARHHDIDIDAAVDGALGAWAQVSGSPPRFAAHGGTASEDVARQNVQARMRMVLSYLMGQLLRASGAGARGGRLLVLGTSNVDEALRGYLTKYDASSADLNPIGSVSKQDLASFLAWASEHLGMPTLREVLGATPTAELAPPTGGVPQSDEAEMGFTYGELSTLGRLRKDARLGPVAMFERLLAEWPDLHANEVAEKVKRFFRHYAANRHKMTTLTPAYHAESYSPDDHRFDLRQFLYDTSWTWQFRQIDRLAAEREERKS